MKFRDIRVSALIFGLFQLIAIAMVLVALYHILPLFNIGSEGVIALIGAVIGYSLATYTNPMNKLTDDSSPPPPTVTEDTHVEVIKEIIGNK